MSEHHRSAEWQRARSKAKPIIEASLPQPCIDCGAPITRRDRWQVGHRTAVALALRAGWTRAQIDHMSNLGPSHSKARGQRACNQIAGGQLGAKLARPSKPTPPSRTDLKALGW